MTRYITRRLLQAIPTLLGVSILSFLLTYSAPGDPCVFQFDPRRTPEDLQRCYLQYGLDQPWFYQYLNWFTGIAIRPGDQVETTAGPRTRCTYLISLDTTVCDRNGGILRGDLGISMRTKGPVWSELVSRMPATLELGLASLLLSLTIGIPLGVLSAVYRGSIFDNIVRFFTVVGQAVPVFWMGLLLIYFLGVVLRLFPTGGRCTVSLSGECQFWDWLHHLVLPAFVLAFGGIAIFSRLMRTEVLEVIHTDYIRTALAKGLAPNNVWFGHAFRNAMIPLMTVLGPAFLGLLGGAVVTETIFSWPGMGRLVIDAVFAQDYPLVLGATMFFAVLVILGNLLSDILYGLVDPRVRFV
jgi:peptide/nickel transport system permease protein